MTDGLQHISVDRICRGQYQPRRHFDDTALDELAESIRTHGLAQPIVVRPQADGYELIAGERRWRAHQRAGLDAIPAVVRDIDHTGAAELTLIENVQREDLDVIEEAAAYQRMINEFGLTQAQLAQKIGVTRSYTANRLRLLTLAADVQELVREGRIPPAMAKTLAGLAPQQHRPLAHKAVEQGWSSRQLEREINKAGQGGNGSQTEKSRETVWLEERLSEHVGSPVTVETKPNGGYKLNVDTPNLDVFEGILERLGFNTEAVE